MSIRTILETRRGRVMTIAVLSAAVALMASCFPPPKTPKPTTTLPSVPEAPVPANQFRIDDRLLDFTYRSAPECSDGVDNDGDGAVDHPADAQCSSPTDDSEVIGSSQSKLDLAISGTYAEDGAVTVPAASTQFPRYYVPIDDPTVPPDVGLGLYVQQVGDATGSVDNVTGRVDLTTQVRVRIDRVGPILSIPPNSWPTNCYIGGSSGFTLNLSTAVTDPPAPNQPVSGTPFSGAGSTVTLVADDFEVPVVPVCLQTSGIVPVDLAPLLNEFFALPSVAGTNLASFDLTLTPA